MAGVLNVSEFLGGPDNIVVEQIFPSNQRTIVGAIKDDAGNAVDLTGWTFVADYQTLIVDEIAFNRSTGKPNFTNSTIIGYFPKVEVSAPFQPEIITASEGTFKVHFPAGMYAGPIIPDARKNVPMTIYSLTWTDDSTPAQVISQRWCFIQNYEPDVDVGDPTLDANYTALVLGG